jgi:hypothetical protein
MQRLPVVKFPGREAQIAHALNISLPLKEEAEVVNYYESYDQTVAVNLTIAVSLWIVGIIGWIVWYQLRGIPLSHMADQIRTICYTEVAWIAITIFGLCGGIKGALIGTLVVAIVTGMFAWTAYAS